MFYKKQGFPEEGDLVICTVKKILHNSVFATLDEYKELEGLIHISEISPGRIRTIRDYVKEGKRIICKILRVNKERHHIELSLRRVSLTQKLKKQKESQQEQKSEKILENLAKLNKTNLEDIYKKVGFKILEQYELLNPCFLEVVQKDESVLTKIGIDKNLSIQLTKLIKDKIKIPKVKITSTLILKTLDPEGIEIIKSTLKKILKLSKAEHRIEINYVGAPNYILTVTSPDFKKAEAALEEINKTAVAEMKNKKGEAEIIRAK